MTRHSLPCVAVASAPAPTRLARVLVLDGETTQALASVRSLGRAGRTVLTASRWSRPLAAWSRYCQAAHRLPGMSRAAFAQLRAWAVQQEVQCVLPMSERSCLLLNLDRDAWEGCGITLGCGSPELLHKAFDKAETLAAARECDVRIPRTCYPRTADDCRSALALLGPCVVKSRFSNAWDGQAFLPDRSCAYAENLADLEQAVAERVQGDAWPLVQEFIPGQGKGLFALCDQGQVVTWFAHERLRDVRPTGSGSSLRKSVAVDPRLQAPAQRLLAALHWHGPAMVEFRDDGTAPPCLMEVNGRFWASLQLAITAGVDFPRLWLQILEGGKVPSPAPFTQGVAVRWLWGDVKRFLYILQGRPRGFTGSFPNRWQGLKELFGRQAERTQLEAWDPDDRWPAFGEWVQGIREVLR